MQLHVGPVGRTGRRRHLEQPGRLRTGRPHCTDSTRTSPSSNRLWQTSAISTAGTAPASPPPDPSPSSATSFAATAAGPRSRPWLVLTAVALGVMMVVLNGTVVAVANPAIGRDLNAQLSDLQWVTNGYLLALAVFLITAGRLGDRFGHKAMFLTGVVGFSTNSLLIGLLPQLMPSSALASVSAFRVLQGVFGAVLQPAALGLLRSTFPAERLSMAIGIWGGCIGASTAAGPIVGGLLVQHIGWEAVFYINVPMGAFVSVVSLRFLGRNKPLAATSRFDVPGIALLSAAMFCLLFGLVNASDWSWGDPRTMGFIAAAFVLGGAFTLRQNRAEHPLLPLTLFRSAGLSAATVVTVLMAFPMYGAMFFITFYFQGVHGLSPLQTGIQLLPMTAMIIVGSPVAGSLMARFGPRPPAVGGMAIAAVAMLGMSTMGQDASSAQTALWFLLLGIGLSPVGPCVTQAVLSNAPLHLSGTASGLQQAAMQVGGSLGTAVLSAVMTSRVGSTLGGHFRDADLPSDSTRVKQATGLVGQGEAPVPPHSPGPVAERITTAAHQSFMDGLHTSFLVACIVTAAGALLTLLVRTATTHKYDEPNAHA